MLNLVFMGLDFSKFFFELFGYICLRLRGN